MKANRPPVSYTLYKHTDKRSQSLFEKSTKRTIPLRAYLSNWLYLLFFTTSIFLFHACSSEVHSNASLKPYAHSELDQIAVVADPILWNSDLQDTFEYYFTSAYPILPHPEPRYDLLYFSPEELLETPLRRELRIYVLLINLSNNKSPLTQMALQDLPKGKITEAETKGHLTVFGYDKWAEGQMLIYMIGKNPEELKKAIVKDFPGIDQKLKAFQKEKVAASVYFGGRARGIEKKIEGQFGIRLKIPAKYKVALEDQNFLWLRDDSRQEVTTGILLYKVPYEDKKQLSYEGFKETRNAAGRYISTHVPNTHMIINDRDLPMFTRQLQLNGIYAIEARGIWEIDHDFMGGPFISYLLLNPKTNELILIDGFVFAPGENKRRYMREVEHLLHSVQLM